MNFSRDRYHHHLPRGEHGAEAAASAAAAHQNESMLALLCMVTGLQVYSSAVELSQQHRLPAVYMKAQFVLQYLFRVIQHLQQVTRSTCMQIHSITMFPACFREYPTAQTEQQQGHSAITSQQPQQQQQQHRKQPAPQWGGEDAPTRRQCAWACCKAVPWIPLLCTMLTAGALIVW